MTLGLMPLRRTRPLALLEREPTSSMSEAELWRGYSPPIVTRACVCGGRIEAHNIWQAISEAVQAHNDTPAHTAWAIAAGWR